MSPLWAHSTAILQHRPGFLSLKVYAAISVLILPQMELHAPTVGFTLILPVLILQHRWNFMLPLWAHSSCNTDQSSPHSNSLLQLRLYFATQTRVHILQYCLI